MRESQTRKTTRVAEIIVRLRHTYPEAKCELSFSSAVELLVATILSARCTDKQVNLVTRQLFAKYRSAADFGQANLSELEQDLKTLGLFRNKAKNIQSCCQALVKNHGGQVPASMAELTQLDGVGRKTANVVLGNAFHQNCGIVVDTHVARLSQRLGLTAETDPEKIELDLQKLVPQELWTMFSHWLIWHGRRRCSARNPECRGCSLNTLCPACPADCRDGSQS